MERRDQTGKKIRGNENILIANNHHLVLGPVQKMTERRDLAVGAEKPAANDQFGFLGWILGDQSAHDIADWIPFGGYAKEDLTISVVAKLEPAFEAPFRFRVATL